MKKNFNKLAVAMMMIAGVMVSSNASAHDLFTSSNSVTNELFPPTVNSIIDKACGKVSGVTSGKVSGLTSGKTSGFNEACGVYVSVDKSEIQSGLTSGKVSGLTSGKTSGFNEACGVYVSVDKEFKGLDITRRRAAGYNEVASVITRIDFASGYRDCKA